MEESDITRGEELELSAAETELLMDSLVKTYPSGIPLSSILAYDDAKVTRSIQKDRKGKLTHHGLDLAVPIGKKIYTPLPGIVTRRGFEPGGGNHITFQPLNSGFTFTFRHLDSFGNTGYRQPLAIGELLGKTGNTGYRTTGPHLHIEVRFKTRIVDPLQVIDVNS